jgi:hypothetical protein
LLRSAHTPYTLRYVVLLLLYYASPVNQVPQAYRSLYEINLANR